MALTKLLDEAHSRNVRYGITESALYYEREFFQLL